MAFRIHMLVTLLVIAGGCSTTYKINSVPEGATVYHKSGGEPAMLGTTPMEFKKSGLPDDAPFVLTCPSSEIRTARIASILELGYRAAQMEKTDGKQEEVRPGV